MSHTALLPRERAKSGSGHARHRRMLARRVTEPTTHKTNGISTFPKRHEALRDRLVEDAKRSPEFLATVFTIHEQPTEDEIVQCIENRLFSMIHEYPVWFGHTPDADAKAQDLRREHAIANGFIKAAPLTERQKAAIATRKQERIEREQRITARANEAVVQAAS